MLASAIYHTAVDVPEELKGKPKEVYKLIMAKNEIEVNGLVFRTFTEQLGKSGIFNITDQTNQNHCFTLEVVIYGLANPHGLSSRLKPMLGVRGKLFDENGQNIIWEKYAYVTNLNDKTPSNESEELLKNPELMDRT